MLIDDRTRIDEVSREKKPEIRLRPLATARGTAVAERKLRHVANDLQHDRETFLLFSDISVFLHLDLGRIYVFSEINIVFSAALFLFDGSIMSSMNNFLNLELGHQFCLLRPSIYLIVARIFGNLLNLAEYFLTEFLFSNFLSLSLSLLTKQKYSWKVRRGVFTNDLLPVM